MPPSVLDLYRNVLPKTNFRESGAIPNCRHVVIEGIGHMTAIEAPDRLANELLYFLQDHPLQELALRGQTPRISPGVGNGTLNQRMMYLHNVDVK